MPVAALLQFSQAAIPAGLAGQAYFANVSPPAAAVVISNAALAPGTVRSTFTLLSCPGASAHVPGVISDGAAVSTTLAPDVPGGYLILLTCYDGAGNSATDTRVIGVKQLMGAPVSALGGGRFIPPQFATDVVLNFGGQTHGWALYLEQWLFYLDTLPVGVATPVVLTAAVAATALVAGTQYLVDTTVGAFTQPLPTNGLIDGEWFEWSDVALLWRGAGAHNLTLSAAATILDPSTIGFGPVYSDAVTFVTGGATFRTTWSAAYGKWFTQ